ncbi:hypothetical protein V8J88_18435 [Massilia sp. W12]|uniref:hypothetical protein n=1 Tax=Massilia sp. W12 TaxID=3126507 RepID=UPI0030CB65D3
MSTCKQPDTPAICAHCPHNPANAELGQQITYLLAEMSAAERAQTLKLIDSILATSRQPPAPPRQSKRGKRR